MTPAQTSFPGAAESGACRPRRRYSARWKPRRCALAQDRSIRWPAELFHHGAARFGAGAGGGSRSPSGRGRRSGTAVRRPVRGEEPVRHRGRDHHGGVEDSRRTSSSGARRHGRGALEGRRRDCHRRAQHGRVRLRIYHGELALRSHAQSARSGAGRGRIVRWFGSGGGGGHGAADDGVGHQRVHPRAGGVLRYLRLEADLRPDFPRGRISVLRKLRPRGAVRAIGRGPRACVRRIARARPARSGLQRPSARTRAAATGARHRRIAHRRRGRILRAHGNAGSLRAGDGRRTRPGSHAHGRSSRTRKWRAPRLT